MNKVQIVEKIQEWARNRGFDKLEFDIDSLMGNMYEERAEYNTALMNYFRTRDSKYISDAVDAIIDGCIFTISDSVKLKTIINYKEINTTLNSAIEDLEVYVDDPFIAFNEVIKEISSRTGKWNDELKKWKKDDIQLNPYKADFSNAGIRISI